MLDVDGGYGETRGGALAPVPAPLQGRARTCSTGAVSRCAGPAVPEAASGLLGALTERGVLALPFDWNGWTGVDLLGPGDVVLGTDELPPGLVRCGAEAVEACRIVAGVPAMGTELTAKTIPAETGMVERTVSFTKGCYTGQELVARIDARGSNVPRRLVGLVLASDDGAVGPGHDPARRGATRRRRCRPRTRWWAR